MIHPTTIVQGEVELADDVQIGPYCLLQGKIKIGSGTIVEGHVSLGSRASELVIGKNNQFSPGAVIGGAPQDLGFKGETTRLKIGDGNVFREFSTANTATTKGDGETTIGDNNYFMAYTHIGHDCKIGNHIVIANDSHLGGHTTVEDHVTIGGVCAFNQFTRVGRGAFIAGSSVVNKDILPFSRAQGNYAVCRATNKIGMQRKGYSAEDIQSIHRAIRILLLGSVTIEEGLSRINAECPPSEVIEYFKNFVKNSKRGIAK